MDGLCVVKIVISIALCSGSTAVLAQSTVSIYEEYGELIQRRVEISAHDTDLFGDKVSLYTGSLEFQQTDVSLPGNSRLSVAVGRRFSPNQFQETDPTGEFGDWSLDIPHLHGTFSNSGWVDKNSHSTFNRCTNFGAPPNATASQGSNGSFASNEYWHGNFLYLPGSGDEELLRSPANGATPVPSDGKSYPIVTKSGAVVRCLPVLASTSSGKGEGFEVLTPDGTTYRFDQLSLGPAPRLSKANPFPSSVSRIATGDPLATIMAPSDYILNRLKVRILPTTVTDRFGNTVTYTWDSAGKLTSITANDGRSLTLTYVNGKVATVSNGARVWRYTYGASGLQSVTLPDGRSWTFALNPIRWMYPYAVGGECGLAPDPLQASRTGSMTHPGGAQGSFTLRPLVYGRSWVPLSCVGASVESSGYSLYPAESLGPALAVKKITGVGLPAAGQAWTYSYGPANNCYIASVQWPSITHRCTSNSPTTRTVTVTGPDGVMTRYTFGNRFQISEGQLLRIDSGWNGTSALRTVVNEYADPAAGPYQNPIGYSPQERSDSYLSSRHTPVRSTTTIQDGQNFIWKVADDCAGSTYCFDTYGRPTRIIRTTSTKP